MKNLNDFELVELAKGGNEKAFTALRNKYWPFVRQRMFVMCRNEQDAEDLAIVAFAKAFTNINSYEPRFAFGTWLHAIAGNNAIDFIRRKKGKKIHVPLDSTTYDDGLTLSDILPTNLKSAEQEITQSEIASTLSRCIQKLSIAEREIINLCFFEGLKYEEIAESLNIPLGTVKGTIYRAKGRLREIYLQAGGEPLKEIQKTELHKRISRKRLFKQISERNKEKKRQYAREYYEKKRKQIAA